MPSNKKIAKNTAFLYFRMAVIMIVTLFTSRVIIASLGVDDYGIYNVVAGITASFNVLLGMFIDASQRFFSYEIGKGDDGSTGEVFSISLMLHIGLSLVVILLAETFGYWLLNNVLIIPVDRLPAANIVFQFTILSFVAVILGTPFDAMIIANERMNVYAYISIADAVLRLSIAYLISISRGDRLIVYAGLLALLQILCSALYYLFCRIAFKNCRFHFTRNIIKIKEMCAFAGWTTLGNLSYMLTTQGVNLLIGSFFAPVVCAARGIAFQVQSAFRAFVVNFQLAINPQIIKSYSAGNIDRCFSLINCSSRISFFLVFIPLIPLISETEFVLRLWLKTVPDGSVTFVRIMLVSQVIFSLRNPIETAIKASGFVKRFMIIFGILGALVLPAGIVCFKLGMPPKIIFLILVIYELLSLIVSLREAKKWVSFNIRSYLKSSIVPVLLTVILSSIIPIMIGVFIPKVSLRIICQMTISPLSALFITYCFGLNNDERNAVKFFICSRLSQKRFSETH